MAFDERTIFRFKLAQLRESVLDRELVRIARVNTGDQCINGMVQEFLPKAANDEFGDAFFLAVAPGRNKRLAQDRQLGFKAEKVGGKKAKRRARHCDGPLVSNHITCFGGRIRVQPPLRQACIANQLADFGRGLQQCIRPELSQKAILAH